MNDNQLSLSNYVLLTVLLQTKKEKLYSENQKNWVFLRMNMKSFLKERFNKVKMEYSINLQLSKVNSKLYINNLKGYFETPEVFKWNYLNYVLRNTRINLF